MLPRVAGKDDPPAVILHQIHEIKHLLGSDLTGLIDNHD